MPKRANTATLLQELIQSQADDAGELMQFYLDQIADLDAKIEALQMSRDARLARVNHLSDEVVKTITDMMAATRRTDAEMYDQIIVESQRMRDVLSQRLDGLMVPVPSSALSDEAVTNVKHINEVEASEAA